MSILAAKECPICLRNTLFEAFCQGCGAYFEDLDEQPKKKSLGQKWLTAYLWYHIYKLNLNVVIAATGAPGSCKSWTGLTVCSDIDPTFDIDRVLFPGIDYIRIFASPELKRGQFIEWDDAGLGAPSREFWSELNRAVGMIAQSSRFRQIGLWITLPDKSFLDSQPRKLIDIHLEFIRRESELDTAAAWVYICETNKRTGKIYYKHPIIRHPDYGGRKLDIIRFPNLPEKNLSDSYESKKHKHMMTFYRQLLEKLETGGVKMNPIQAKTLMVAVELWDQMGYKRKSLAERLGMHEKSLSRSVKRAYEVVARTKAIS